MARVSDAVEDLRGRFRRVRGGQSFHTLAPLVGVNAATIRQFFYGGNLRLNTLCLIEAWCDTREAASTSEDTPDGPHC